MVTSITATQVRNEFADIINRAVYNDEEFIVEKQGKPVVKIIRVSDSVLDRRATTFQPPVFAMGGTKKIITRNDIYE